MFTIESFLGKVLFLEDDVDGAKDVADDERRLLQPPVHRKEIAREVVEHHLGKKDKTNEEP